MELYLVQHGESKPEEEDPARPLTERGRREVARSARAVARAGVRPILIAHSGKLRAAETAQVLAEQLKPARGPIEMAGLGPKDDPALVQAEIARASEPLMLVGHLPHLSRLASLLLVGESDREVVAFRMGGIVCLTEDQGRWRVRWALTPEFAPT